MPNDENLDFLEVVHAIVSSADRASAAIDQKLSEHPNQETVEVKVASLAKIRMILNAQAQLLRAQTEHNQEVLDQLNKLIENL